MTPYSFQELKDKLARLLAYLLAVFVVFVQRLWVDCCHHNKYVGTALSESCGVIAVARLKVRGQVELGVSSVSVLGTPIRFQGLWILPLFGSQSLPAGDSKLLFVPRDA